MSKKIVWFIDNKLGNLSGKDKTKPKILKHKSKKAEKLNLTYKGIANNPFQANVPILYPLKTPENQRFLVFSGCIKWEHCLKWIKPHLSF